jgi:hypothetical protein
MADSLKYDNNLTPQTPISLSFECFIYNLPLGKI